MNAEKRLADAYIRIAIGENVHVPLNMIFKGTGEPDKVTGVFQFQDSPDVIRQLLGGADIDDKKGPHVLLIGDAFIRAKIISQSKHLIGVGFAGLAMSGFIDIDDWVKGTIHKGKF